MEMKSKLQNNVPVSSIRHRKIWEDGFFLLKKWKKLGDWNMLKKFMPKKQLFPCEVVEKYIGTRINDFTYWDEKVSSFAWIKSCWMLFLEERKKKEWIKIVSQKKMSVKVGIKLLEWKPRWDVFSAHRVSLRPNAKSTVALKSQELQQNVESNRTDLLSCKLPEREYKVLQSKSIESNSQSWTKSEGDRHQKSDIQTTQSRTSKIVQVENWRFGFLSSMSCQA